MIITIWMQITSNAHSDVAILHLIAHAVQFLTLTATLIFHTIHIGLCKVPIGLCAVEVKLFFDIKCSKHSTMHVHFMSIIKIELHGGLLLTTKVSVIDDSVHLSFHDHAFTLIHSRLKDHHLCSLLIQRAL